MERLAPDDDLAGVLRRIREHDFSQFPVYHDGVFRGLLTENGITRWLARHISDKDFSGEALSCVAVSEVLRQEEARGENFAFVRRNESAYRVRQMFAEGDLLEAVLVTHTARRSTRHR